MKKHFTIILLLIAGMVNGQKREHIVGTTYFTLPATYQCVVCGQGFVKDTSFWNIGLECRGYKGTKDTVPSFKDLFNKVSPPPKGLVVGGDTFKLGTTGSVFRLINDYRPQYYNDTIAVYLLYSNVEPQEMVGWNTMGRYEVMETDYAAKWMKGYFTRESDFQVYYLDRNKQRLAKNIVVWTAKKLN